MNSARFYNPMLATFEAQIFNWSGAFGITIGFLLYFVLIIVAVPFHVSAKRMRRLRARGVPIESHIGKLFARLPGLPGFIALLVIVGGPMFATMATLPHAWSVDVVCGEIGGLGFGAVTRMVLATVSGIVRQRARRRRRLKIDQRNK